MKQKKMPHRGLIQPHYKIIVVLILLFTLLMTPQVTWSQGGQESITGGGPPPVQPDTFIAILTGDSEVPPVATEATGTAIFTDALNYTVQVGNINNVFAAHIHLGPAGENGPVVAFLFNAGSPNDICPDGGFSTTATATLAQGTLSDSDLVGPLANQTISDLIAQIQANNAYVNVHTCANRGGEIRGQIFIRETAPPSVPAVPTLSTSSTIALVVLLLAIVAAFVYRRPFTTT